MHDLPALRAAEHRRARRNLLIATLGVLLAVLGAVYMLLEGGRADTAEVQRDDAIAERRSIGERLAAECEAGITTGPICFDADAIAAAPTLVPGQPGEDGRDGRGIVSTSITDGRLSVTYTDGVTVDVGSVRGGPGRGIASTSITDGRLVITYTDGATADVGRVVGRDGDTGQAGRSVTSADAVDGRLIITYSDGTSDDAGPLPPGPPGPEGPTGPPGQPGPACPDGFEPVETSGARGADGTRYDRAITCVDPDSAQPTPGTG